MGSCFMHLAVSKRLKEKFDFSDDFLIGSIAPDILKFVLDRNTTHYLKEYRENGIIKQLPDIEKFINENVSRNDDYFYGYLAHLVQDKVWFDKYIPTFAESDFNGKIIFKTDNLEHTGEEFARIIYNDYNAAEKRILETTQIDIQDLKNKTKEYFEKKDIPGINEIIDTQIRKYSREDDNETYFLTSEVLHRYLNEAYEECLKYINERNK